MLVYQCETTQMHNVKRVLQGHIDSQTQFFDRSQALVRLDVITFRETSYSAGMPDFKSGFGSEKIVMTTEGVELN